MKKLFKKIGGLVKGLFGVPLVRGVIKSLPFGNLVYEVGENIVSNLNNESNINKIKKPHSAISILAQIVFLSLIVWAFASGKIDVATIFDYVGIEDFKNFNPLDSLSK